MVAVGSKEDGSEGIYVDADLTADARKVTSSSS